MDPELAASVEAFFDWLTNKPVGTGCTFTIDERESIIHLDTNLFEKDEFLNISSMAIKINDYYYLFLLACPKNGNKFNQLEVIRSKSPPKVVWSNDKNNGDFIAIMPSEDTDNPYSGIAKIVDIEAGEEVSMTFTVQQQARAMSGKYSSTGKVGVLLFGKNGIPLLNRILCEWPVWFDANVDK